MGKFDSIQTAEQMTAYCREFGLGQGSMKDWDLKHFRLIEEALLPNEKVITVFEGIHNYRSVTKHDGNFAYAITTKRIIMAQKKLIGSVVQSVNINNVNDITVGKGALLGVLTFDTTKEVFNVCVNREHVMTIHDFVHRSIETVKEEQAGMERQSKDMASVSNELIELKKLVDAGIITEDEFAIKKKQLLGL